MAKLRGFTLFEMVIAIVVLSIIMIGIGSYIAIGVKGYSNTVDRERLQSQARFLVARMTKEIRHAAPNSLSYTSNCLSFYPIIAPAVYYDSLPNNSNTIAITPLRFSTNWSNSGNFVAVGFASSEQYKNNTIAVSSITAPASKDETYQLTLTSPIEDASSPGKRLYLYKDKISYCLIGKTIVRKVNDGDGILMAENIDKFIPNVQTTGLNSNAIALFSIQYLDLRTQEKSDYNHSVQVMNVL
ncbi:prepilin-type N-terminal cleavage/methylation domain-containing protein [Photobacterium angustum]|uniref:Prepilin-type N-terminal cleavage/methylation domain-containing protein n=1 Tax=Photobacterium angustum TaxID=661 RepID=A0A855SDD2_PHOAN|nr:type II secretion system protein [Photobacterium angustum]KJF81133.1 type IV prepilin, MshO [Photobacterium damselae subsp. damselae]KJG29547.1 type IV prepilin, MshO [Photobacterium angustum]KJG39281.1 type IV prepilin, MshO [Photobacterium angustum]KJG44645.1 type IV prepilin, MshO [Photobacterium angustum]KJG48316.1 type IV prepilin, MshO [Photobacterium angustum]